MEQKNTSEISVTCLCSYLSIFDLLDWAELFSPVRFDFSASGGPVEVMLESAPPPAGGVQQYTCSQYSRSQKSTSGGHGPGWVVGGTGGETALKWAVWTSYLPFHLFCPGFIYLYLCFHWGEVTCAAPGCRLRRNRAAVTERQKQHGTRGEGGIKAPVHQLYL